MALFKSKKSPLDRMKPGEIKSQIGELEKKKILLGAEIKKDESMIARLKEDGQDRSTDERKSIAYRILRIDNGLKLKRRRIESIEKEILGLDNVRNLLDARQENRSRNSSIMEADIEAIKEAAMEDRIKSEEYEKKLAQLSELSQGDKEADDSFISKYAESIWETGKSEEKEKETSLDRKIEDIVREKSGDEEVKDN